MPKVSVIIPTYNGGRYLSETLESVFCQTFQDFEVIVIDDGSTEDLKPVLTNYAGRIQYVYTPNGGPAKARNQGILRSNGDYIAFLDHDDVWEPEKLQTQVAIMDRFPDCGLVYSYHRIIDTNGQEIPNVSPRHFPEGKVFFEFFQRNRITTFSAALVRKAVILELGLLDEDEDITICDDYDMWLRIADRHEVRFSPGLLTRYRVHEMNLLKNVRQYFRAKKKVLIKTIECSEHLKRLRKTERNTIVNQRLHRMYQSFGYRFYYLGYYSEARETLFKAFKLEPHNFRDLAFALISAFPVSVINMAKRVKRTIPLKYSVSRWRR